MQVRVQKIEKLKHKLSIELSGKEFTEKKNNFYQETAKKLKVPGFRPGKAPLEVIEKHHGQTLQQNFIKEHIPDIYQQAIEENSISPSGLPKISDIKITPETLSFTAEIEIQPEIEVEPPIYKGIKINTQKTKPATKQIDETIKKLKEEIKKITNKEVDETKVARWASFPDLDSFKEAIQAQIYLENIQNRRRDIENQIKNHLLKTVKLEVPKAEVQRYHQQLVNQQIQQLKQQGLKEEDLAKYKDNFEKKLKPLAENEVKFFYILKAIAKKEKLQESRQMIEAVLGLILSEAKFS